jgi:hypothetical protein
LEAWVGRRRTRVEQMKTRVERMRDNLIIGAAVVEDIS